MTTKAFAAAEDGPNAAGEERHLLSEKDATALAALRIKVAPFKGQMSGIDARGTFDDMMEQVPDMPGITYNAGTVGGVPGMWCRPEGAPPDAAILYRHGGAYVVGSAKAYRHFIAQIAARYGVAAFVVDYRLAAENVFAAAIDDARAAYRGLITQSARVAIVGDSAGGGLPLSLLALVQDSVDRGEGVAPVAVVVMSPWTDLALTGASQKDRANDDLLVTRDMLATAAKEYLAGHDPLDPIASPPHANLKSSTPLQLHVGTSEVLLDDSRLYANRFGDAGGHAVVHVWEGMVRVFPSNIGILEASEAAVAIMSAFIKEKLMANAQ